MDDCNADCHRVERHKIRLETEVLIRLILDGDEEHIRMLLEAMRDNEAA